MVKALAQRPNFYSAAVYLAQSSANLMILTNLLFVIASTLLLGLQKLLYGNLRPIEVEQLYEKAWFAVTETCLAMTVFRGEIGLTFLSMFFSLLAGKVWGWIGEGRVELLEQQPPRNPRLFHTRLALSLGLSVAFDMSMLEYVVKQVARQAKPDMMVMFGFEFAVLSITSISTAVRYAINLIEIGIVREQKRQRIEQIKKERMHAAVTEYRELLAQESSPSTTTPPQDEQATQLRPSPTRRTLEQVMRDSLNEPVDDNEVEVEGWEDKGRYVFYLDLATDFFKLVIYLAFFFILLVFYGLPIHILRDVFLTMRSFIKRISDFMKYRTATRDMNERYPDATAEDIGREDVCIICREEMRPYEPPVIEAGGPRPPPNPIAERMRPKKLPCGHVLHFSCLRSWLERQQICPTCRANVVQTGQGTNGITGARANAGAPAQAAGGQGQAGPHPPAARPGPRVYQFGPLRIGLGAVRGGNMLEDLQQRLAAGDAGGVAGAGRGPQPPADVDPNAPRQFGLGVRWTGVRRRRRDNQELTTRERLDAVEAQIRQEIETLTQSANELTVLRSLQAELERLRNQAPGQAAPNLQSGLPPPPVHRAPATLMADAQQPPVGSGSDRLPPGVTLPEGWTMLPLQSASPGHQIQQVSAFSVPAASIQHFGSNGQFLGTMPGPLPSFPQFPQFTPVGQFPPPVLPRGLGGPTPQAGTGVGASGPLHTNGTSASGHGQPSTTATQETTINPENPLLGSPSSLQQHNLQQLDQLLASLPDGAGSGQPDIRADISSTEEATRQTNGELHQDQPPQPAITEPASSLPLPQWGASSSSHNADSNGNSAQQMNGEQQAESSSATDNSPAEPKKRHATVEDLVEDPD